MITTELLKATNYKTKNLAKHNITTYPDCKIEKLIDILSNYMTIAKLRNDEYCGYCTKVMKH